MDKRLGSSTGLAALLFIILHFFGGSSADHPANPAPAKKEAASDSSSTTAQDSAKAFDTEGPWKATQQYFHRAPLAVTANCQTYLLSSGPVDSSGCDRGVLLVSYGFDKDFKPKDLTTLIATVPDPLHTRMSVETDRYLDAIQQAAYRSGWELATQWLPWTIKARQSATAASAQSTRGVDVEKLPGLLVFRRHFTGSEVVSKVVSKLLLVFIVGETPTAGMNGFQFEAARRSLCTLGSDNADRIAI